MCMTAGLGFDSCTEYCINSAILTSLLYKVNNYELIISVNEYYLDLRSTCHIILGIGAACQHSRARRTALKRCCSRLHEKIQNTAILKHVVALAC